jgi:integrase
MSHSHRHPKSRNEWFRLDVPARLRGLVGKTSWKHSLQTTDKQVAAVKRAELTSHYKAEIVRLDGILATSESQDAKLLVDRALELMAARNGSLDSVIRAVLTFMTLRARQSWGRKHLREAEWDFGLIFHDNDEDGAEAPSDPLPGFDTDDERDAFVTRQRLIEHRGFADGIIYQEVARRLLDRQAWAFVEVDLLALMHCVGVELTVGTPQYAAAAEHLLRRLADHRFGDWQPNFREAVAPVGAEAVAPTIAPAQNSAATILPPPVALGHPISVVLADWRNESKATLKSKDEFARYVARFIAFVGDIPVQSITKRMVVDWKKILTRLPPQPKADIASLPLEEQAAFAEANNLKCLSPKSIKKHLQALRSVLKHAKHEMLILEGELPTEGVTITIGADEEIDILPFDEQQLALIFSQALMCDPDEGDPDMFWFLLLAPLSGCRLEEMAQLRPFNIRAEKDIPFIAIERDRLSKRQEIADAGGAQKRLKTRNTTTRNIPVHPILQRAGFLDYAEVMRSRGAEWLFDDLREYEKYGQRGKYMSNKLMRFLRRIGITDRENVFHSFRHSLKRELRDDEKTKEEISDLLTGHSFAESVGRKYARGAGLRTLAAAIGRVNYDTVDWDRVAATGRARVERLRRQAAA